MYLLAVFRRFLVSCQVAMVKHTHSGISWAGAMVTHRRKMQQIIPTQVGPQNFFKNQFLEYVLSMC